MEFVDFSRKADDLINSSMAKNLEFLRWFLRWCYKHKFNPIDDFETFRPKLKSPKKRVIFLNDIELQKLEVFKIPPKYARLEKIRDMFLFQCFTSLRFSDMQNLRWTDVMDDYILVTTIKTYESLVIDLNDHSRAILKKYRHYRFMQNKVFPQISNATMNQSIHLLCKLAGFNEPIRIVQFKGSERIEKVVPKYKLIGSHTGRRSFISNGLSKGIPAEIMMKWTGHSDWKAMQPYIEITNEAKSNFMKLFNKNSNCDANNNEDEKKKDKNDISNDNASNDNAGNINASNNNVNNDNKQ